MAENPLEPQVKAAVQEMRRRMDIIDRAVPEKTIPVGHRQLSAMELYMRDAFVPGFRQEAIGQAEVEDIAKYLRTITKGKKSFLRKHGNVQPG